MISIGPSVSSDCLLTGMTRNVTSLHTMEDGEGEDRGDGKSGRQGRCEKEEMGKGEKREGGDDGKGR